LNAQPGSFGQKMKNYILSLAYPRTARAPDVIWNGVVSSSHCPVKRDGLGTDQSGCVASSSISSIPTSNRSVSNITASMETTTSSQPVSNITVFTATSNG